MEEKTTQRMRATAYKIPIQAILKSRYVKEEGEFTPNYIEAGDVKVSRANVIGIVVSLDEKESGTDSIAIDDGNGRISVRGFEQDSIPAEVRIGDIVNVIGRIREFGNERYIVPEIIRKTDKKWMIVRMAEIAKEGLFEEDTVPSEPSQEIEEEDLTKTNDTTILTDRERILDYIKGNDKGMGIDIEEIIEKTEVEDCERIIEEMLKEGELFENMPGKVKVLE